VRRDGSRREGGSCVYQHAQLSQQREAKQAQAPMHQREAKQAQAPMRDAYTPTTGGQPTMAAGQRAGGWPSSLLYLGPGTTSVLVLVWVCFGRCSRRWHCGTARPRVGYTRCCPDSRCGGATADCYQRRLQELRWRGARARLRRGAVPTIWGQGRRGACESRSKGTVTPSPTLPAAPAAPNYISL